MAKKLHESAKIILQILLPCVLLLFAPLISGELRLPMFNKILAVCECILFAIACALNLFHFFRLSLTINKPPYCWRKPYKHLRLMVLLLAMISGAYLILSIIWLLSYEKQQLIAQLDMLYTILEIGLSAFAIIFACFIQVYINQERSERIEECPHLEPQK